MSILGRLACQSSSRQITVCCHILKMSPLKEKRDREKKTGNCIEVTSVVVQKGKK